MDSPTNQRNKQEVVVELFHELALAPDTVERLQEQRPEQLLRRDRGAAGVGIQQGEAGRQILQGLIHHRPDPAEGMVLRDPLFRLNVAPHMPLLGIAAAHRAPPRESGCLRRSIRERAIE
jgi:hypothetical protein